MVTLRQFRITISLVVFVHVSELTCFSEEVLRRGQRILECPSFIHSTPYKREIKSVLLANIPEHAGFPLVGDDDIPTPISSLSAWRGPSNVSRLVSTVVVNAVYGPSFLRSMSDVSENPIPECHIIVDPFGAHLDSTVVIIPRFNPLWLASTLCVAPCGVEVAVFSGFSMRGMGFPSSFDAKASTTECLLAELVTNNSGLISAVTFAEPRRIVLGGRTSSEPKHNEFSESLTSPIIDEFVHTTEYEMYSLEEVKEYA